MKQTPCERYFDIMPAALPHGFGLVVFVLDESFSCRSQGRCKFVVCKRAVFTALPSGRLDLVHTDFFVALNAVSAAGWLVVKSL
jgi:hypothetical protein